MIKNMPKRKFVHIICGVPGAGKSTYAKLWRARYAPNAPIITVDYYLHEYMEDHGVSYYDSYLQYGTAAQLSAVHEIQLLVSAGKSVIIDELCLTEIERAAYLSLFPSEYLMFCTYIERNKEWLDNVHAERGTDKYISPLVISAMHRRWQRPTAVYEDFDVVEPIDAEIESDMFGKCGNDCHNCEKCSH